MAISIRVGNSIICSNRSGQMSDCERIAQVAHDKWANVSVSLWSLRTNERIAWFFLSKSLISLSLTINEQFPQKNSKDCILCTFLTFFKIFLKKQKIRSFLLSAVSESLRSHRTNERLWVIRSGRSEGMRDRERITQVAHQKWAERSSKIWWANSQPLKVPKCTQSPF